MIGLVCPQSGCGGAVVLDSACRAGSVSLRELRVGTGTSVCVRHVTLSCARHVQCGLTQRTSSTSRHRVRLLNSSGMSRPNLRTSDARRCRTPLAAAERNKILGQLEAVQVQPFEAFANEMVGESQEATRAAVDQMSAILKVRILMRHARQTQCDNQCLDAAAPTVLGLLLRLYDSARLFAADARYASHRPRRSALSRSGDASCTPTTGCSEPRMTVWPRCWPASSRHDGRPQSRRAGAAWRS